MKLGYERYVAVCAWLGKGNRSGMPVDVQVSWHNFTAHTQRQKLKWRSRQQWHHLMMSLTSLLHKSREAIIESAHEPLRLFFLVLWSIHWFASGLFPGWFIWEAAELLTQLPQCLLRSGIITLQESVLYLLTVHAQGYLGHLKLACFSYL